MPNTFHDETRFGAGANYVSLTQDGVRLAGAATATLNLDSNPFVPNPSQWSHQLAKNATGIDGTGKTLSSMLICRLYRDPADAADTYPQDVAFLQFDVHYEIDSLGSETEYGKTE